MPLPRLFQKRNSQKGKKGKGTSEEDRQSPVDESPKTTSVSKGTLNENSVAGTSHDPEQKKSDVDASSSTDESQKATRARVEVPTEISTEDQADGLEDQKTNKTIEVQCQKAREDTVRSTADHRDAEGKATEASIPENAGSSPAAIARRPQELGLETVVSSEKNLDSLDPSPSDEASSASDEESLDGKDKSNVEQELVENPTGCPTDVRSITNVKNCANEERNNVELDECDKEKMLHIPEKRLENIIGQYVTKLIRESIVTAASSEQEIYDEILRNFSDRRKSDEDVLPLKAVESIAESGEMDQMGHDAGQDSNCAEITEHDCEGKEINCVLEPITEDSILALKIPENDCLQNTESEEVAETPGASTAEANVSKRVDIVGECCEKDFETDTMNGEEDNCSKVTVDEVQPAEQRASEIVSSSESLRVGETDAVPVNLGRSGEKNSIPSRESSTENENQHHKSLMSEDISMDHSSSIPEKICASEKELSDISAKPEGLPLANRSSDENMKMNDQVISSANDITTENPHITSSNSTAIEEVRILNTASINDIKKLKVDSPSNITTNDNSTNLKENPLTDISSNTTNLKDDSPTNIATDDILKVDNDDLQDESSSNIPSSDNTTNLQDDSAKIRPSAIDVATTSEDSHDLTLDDDPCPDLMGNNPSDDDGTPRTGPLLPEESSSSSGQKDLGEDLPERQLPEDEKKVSWKVGHLHVKLPHQSRGKGKLKAWKKRCVAIQPDEFVDEPGHPSLVLSVYSAEGRKHASALLWKTVSGRNALVYRSKSGSHRYAFTVAEDGRPVLHLAADSESESQQWMAAIRGVLWPSSPVVQLEKVLNGASQFEVSVVDNEFGVRAGLLGAYGVMVVTPRKLILVDAHLGHVLQEWYLHTVDQFRLVAHQRPADARAVVAMLTCSDSSTGSGELVFYCKEAVALLQAVAATVHHVLQAKDAEESGSPYKKELEQLAGWLSPQGAPPVAGEEHYRVPPRQVKSLLDIPNFAFDKPMASAVPSPTSTTTMTSQDSGVGLSSDDLHCSLTSFTIGGSPARGRSSSEEEEGSELSDAYSPPQTPEEKRRRTEVTTS